MHLKLKVSLRFLPFVLGPVFTHFNPAKSALKVCFDAHCYTNSLLHNWILSYSHLLLFRFTHCCFAFATKRSFAAVTTRQAVRTFVIFLSSYPTWILEVTTRSPVMKLRWPVFDFRYITKRWKPKMRRQYFFLPIRWPSWILLLRNKIFNSYSSRTRRIWADIYNQRGRRLLSAHIRQIREE